ncbi:acyltransferase [Consotaella aegiceratis]|uniref:acyltransferase n=1 Tax=Consotaella aegiceratis TaxID=3097961 RepID=UPI002F3F34DA
MRRLLVLPYTGVRLLRRARRRLKIINLRLRGVVVDSTANIDPAAIFEPSGGRITLGARTLVDRGVIIRPHGGRVDIGDDCSVHAYSVLYGGGGLRIGNGVRIASHTVVVPSNHVFSNAQTPIKDQGLTRKGVVIEDNVWIGAGVRILDGVVVGRGAVIGAGAVVTRSVEAFAVVVGVPAKVIRRRQ